MTVLNFAFKIVNFQFHIFVVSLYHCIPLTAKNNALLEKRLFT